MLIGWYTKNIVEDVLKKILAFRKARDWEQFHTPSNISKSISIEAAELLECFQWSDTDYDLTEVRHELADVYIYLLSLAHDLKIDLNKAALEKLEISAKKYPVHLSRGKSTKYTKL